jgi:hypothetical protein
MVIPQRPVGAFARLRPVVSAWQALPYHGTGLPTTADLGAVLVPTAALAAAASPPRGAPV